MQQFFQKIPLNRKKKNLLNVFVFFQKIRPPTTTPRPSTFYFGCGSSEGARRLTALHAGRVALTGPTSEIKSRWTRCCYGQTKWVNLCKVCEKFCFMFSFSFCFCFCLLFCFLSFAVFLKLLQTSAIIFFVDFVFTVVELV